MKKLVVLSIVAMIFSVIMVSRVFAADEGGLSYNMDTSHLSLGFTLGTVFDQLSYKSCTRASCSNTNDIDVWSKIMQAKVGFALTRQLNLFGIAGFSDLTATKNATFNGNLGFLYGAGIKFSPLDNRNGAGITLDAQYDRNASMSGSDSATVDNIQFAANFSNRIGNFVPFMGVKYLIKTVAITQGGETINYKADRFNGFSFYGGFDYFVSGNIFIHNELHNLGEDAIFLGMGFVF